MSTGHFLYALPSFRQLGQYEDIELDGLYYNRFRYYDSNSGLYIAKDPIGLAGNNPTFYAYVWDSNGEVDIFGLTNQPLGTPFKIDVNGRWHDSEGKFTKFVYPPNDGFEGLRIKKQVSQGTLLDRFGGWFEDGRFNDRGRFFADSGASFLERSLPPIKEGTILTTYKVIKPFEVEFGKIAPWFGEKGMGLQYYSLDIQTKSGQLVKQLYYYLLFD